MRSEKSFSLGRVRIDGDLIEFVPEKTLQFEAERSDQLSLGIQYDYREASEEKERARVRITAQLDGHAPETFEAEIRDNPVLNDSHRGFVSVPIRTPKPGDHRGRFVVEATYGSGLWGEKEPDTQVHERAEGSFVLRVR